MLFKKTKFTRKAIAILLSGALLIGFTGCSNDDDNNTSPSGTAKPADTETVNNASSIDYGLAENTYEGSMIQAWCWDFKTIEENLADLAAAGFTAVQTTPINACVDPGGMAIRSNTSEKGMWYYHYQPIDWTIGNYQLGTREEFASMCSEAEKYGIKIIVDVVPNHTGSSTLVLDGLANSVGGIDNLYHPNGFTNLTNYSNRLMCTSYASGGLADVDTENPGFQDYFIAFMNDCIECGADGFRFDTAKHIALPDDPVAVEGEENNFWTRVTSDEITNRDNIYMYGEVLQGDNERLEDYANVLDGVVTSNYGNVIRVMANSKNLDAEKVLNFRTTADPSKLVTWVESHDNYCNDKSYALLDNDEVAFGWAIIASIGEGTPLFFSRPAGADEETWEGTINLIGYKGDDNYKNPIVVATNKFRNATVGEDVNVSNIDTEKHVLMIERGSKGVVILNGLEEDYQVDVDVKLADGTYTDRTGLNGDFTVSGGKLTGTIAPWSVIVLCNDGYVENITYATASIDNEDGIILGDDYSLTLHCENAVSAQYSLIYANDEGIYDEHNADKTDFTDGTAIPLGSELTNGESVIVKLYVTNEKGITSTNSYRLKKKDTIKSGDQISFISNNSWGSDVYAYLYYYDESGNKQEVSAWPGEKMTNTEGFAYSYTINGEYTTLYVFFTDGTKQSPLTDEGYEVEAGKQYN